LEKTLITLLNRTVCKPARLSGLIAVALTATSAFAEVSVLNVNYDKRQTGANLQETIIQAPGFDWKNFGKVGTYPVDGQVYAQPLYVPGVTIGGHAYNVLYVATMHNSVYAFDADSPQTATPIWHVNLGPTVPSGTYNFTDVLPEIGILSTPVIDSTHQEIYVVSNTVQTGSLSTPIFLLHALSTVDGRELFGGPHLIAATIPGTGAGSHAGSIAFDATQQLQRTGLVMANGLIYVGFGSHSDVGNYHGWLMAFNATTLKLEAVFNSSPNGRQSAFWQSGRGVAVDSNGDIFVATGNGDYDGKANFGSAVMHFSGPDLSLKDWYTPEEFDTLNSMDEDVGSTGAILIPNTNLVLSAGKSGRMSLIQTNSMGHLGADNGPTVQTVQVNTWGAFNMVVWPQTTPIVYEFEPFGNLKAFQISGGQLNATILSQYSPSIPTAYCGIALSANNSKNGVVWFTSGDYSQDGVPGTLHALDANNLANELWNSGQAADGRDAMGGLAKFATPTIVNGRVYVPTFSNAVSIYGVLSTSGTPPTGTISAVLNAASFLGGAVAPGELVSIFGANIGPTPAAGAQLAGQHITTETGNTAVLFDGVEAPVLFTSATQINAVVPFGVAGPNTKIQILYQGTEVASITMPVQAASPAVFSLDGSGGGPGAILNHDLTINTDNNEAPRGTFVVLYATGFGLTNPASENGLITGSTLSQPNLDVSVTIEGVPAKVLYVGAAPGLVAGMIQINVVVPDTAWVAPFDQVVVKVGDFVSPSAVTVAVSN
jgi:uncharacterized protein (TIGR03437 family)